MNKFAVAVVVVLVAGFFQESSSETTCQSHQKVSGGSNALMQWDIKCDDEGMYLPMQCTVNTPKWCMCFNKEEAVTTASKNIKTCDCPLKKDEALKKNPNNPCAPKCTNEGKFEKKQCCSTTQKCHCVNPVTGVKTSEPTTNMNLQCQ